jgi:hypothetical protein
MFNVLGVGLSFILGTYLVRESPVPATTTTGISSVIGDFNAGENYSSSWLARNITVQDDMEGVRGDVERLLYLQAGASAVLLLLVILYYPRYTEHRHTAFPINHTCY